MSEQKKYDVALSYAREDRTYVDHVAHLLSEHGVAIFYDKFEQADLWGKNLYTHLQGVYRDQARFTIVFCSQHYAKKVWTTHERESAQERAFRESSEYLLPARFDDTEIPGLSSTIAYLDLRSLTPEELTQLVLIKLGFADTPQDARKRAEDVTTLVDGVKRGLASPEQNGNAIEQIAVSRDPHKQAHLQSLLLSPSISFMETAIIHECLRRLRDGELISNLWMHGRAKALQDIRTSLEDYEGHPEVLGTLLQVKYMRHLTRKDAPGYRQLEKVITDVQNGQYNPEEISQLTNLFRGQAGA